MTPLANKIRDYIVKCTETSDLWVTKEQICRAAEKTGVPLLNIIQALSLVHHMGDIEVRARNDTVVYRLRRVAPPKALLPTRLPQTPEQRVELQDFIDNCPFVSDEERECMRTPFKDRSDRCHYLTDTPAGYQLTMERKYTPMKWKRMCMEEATSDIMGV